MEKQLTHEEKFALDIVVRDMIDVDMTAGRSTAPDHIQAKLTSSDHSGILIYAKSQLSGREFFYRFPEPSNPYILSRTKD